MTVQNLNCVSAFPIELISSTKRLNEGNVVAFVVAALVNPDVTPVDQILINVVFMSIVKVVPDIEHDEIFVYLRWEQPRRFHDISGLASYCLPSHKPLAASIIEIPNMIFPGWPSLVRILGKRVDDIAALSFANQFDAGFLNDIGVGAELNCDRI